jgi:hypothetical protein
MQFSWYNYLHVSLPRTSCFCSIQAVLTVRAGMKRGNRPSFIATTTCVLADILPFNLIDDGIFLLAEQREGSMGVRIKRVPGHRGDGQYLSCMRQSSLP